MQGVYSLLRWSNLSIEFFTDEELETRKLSGFELVWFPAAFCMTPEQTAAVADYTAQGGTAVFEAFAGMINLDTGLHEDTLPGCGLAELSGVELDSVFSTAMIENAYDWKLVMNVDSDEISMRMGEIPMKGAKYLLRYSNADAEVLAEFSDGTPSRIPPQERRRIGRSDCNAVRRGLRALCLRGQRRVGGAADSKCAA